MAPRPAPSLKKVRREKRSVRLSPRARSWLVGLLLILSFSGILYAVVHYVRVYRSVSSPAAAARTTVNQTTAIGREFLTTTDVHLRRGRTRRRVR